MPDQRPKRFAIQIFYENGWETEVYTDWYKYAIVVAARYIGFHKTRIVDMRFKRTVWEIE